MALDAHVCCDCFERGRLHSPPPPSCNLSVDPDGSLWCGSDDLDVQIAFDRWQQYDACEHVDGRLITHRIGNITLVASLRRELGLWPERFPVILSRVVYNGVHAGDFIAAAEVPQLAAEVKATARTRGPSPQSARRVGPTPRTTAINGPGFPDCSASIAARTPSCSARM